MDFPHSIDVSKKQLPVNFYSNQTITYPETVSQVASNFVVIDSRSRNWDKEDSNDYIIQTNEKFQNVVSIALVDAYIPSSGYVLTEHNNLIIVIEEYEEHSKDKEKHIHVRIPCGYYTIDTLSTKIGELMTQNSFIGQIYTVSCDDISRKVSISSQSKFSLIFHEGEEVIGDSGFADQIVTNKHGKKEIKKVDISQRRKKYVHDSIGSIIGFKPHNLYGKNSYTGQMIYDLNPYEYVSIYVNTENDEDFKQITAPSPNGGADGSFAIAHLGRGEDFYKILNFTDNSYYIRHFNPPIQFSKIKVSFRTADGYKYEFEGLNNYLVFEIKQAFERQIITNLSQLTLQ